MIVWQGYNKQKCVIYADILKAVKKWHWNNNDLLCIEKYDIVYY